MALMRSSITYSHCELLLWWKSMLLIWYSTIWSGSFKHRGWKNNHAEHLTLKLKSWGSNYGHLKISGVKPDSQIKWYSCTILPNMAKSTENTCQVIFAVHCNQLLLRVWDVGRIVNFTNTVSMFTCNVSCDLLRMSSHVTMADVEFPSGLLTVANSGT